MQNGCHHAVAPADRVARAPAGLTWPRRMQLAWVHDLAAGKPSWRLLGAQEAVQGGQLLGAVEAVQGGRSHPATAAAADAAAVASRWFRLDG